MIKHFKTKQALAFILNILLTRNTFAQQQIRGITHNDLDRLEVDKSGPFLEATMQANFAFCDSIPGIISKLLCASVPFYEKICPDNCGSGGDDDDDDNNGGGCSPEGKDCYFCCRDLTISEYGDTVLSQVGNCGKDCYFGIAPDINGVKHSALYLLETYYVENGEEYGYDTGPLNVQGTDKNMFNRCYNECFAANDNIKKDQTSKNFGITEK